MIDDLFDKIIKWLEVQCVKHDNPPFLEWLYWFLVETQEYLDRKLYKIKQGISERFSQDDYCPWQEQVEEYGEPYHSRF